MEHTSNDKISEALKLLEEAAIQKKDELKSVLSDKYTHLRDVVMDTESSLVKSLAATRKQAIAAALEAKERGVEKAREIAGEVDQHVHRNPWQYIAGTAALGLLVGYLLGRNRK
jgi:ElaB/YqjD/DUF883 family membrane-anchored ribosome-binding protein